MTKDEGREVLDGMTVRAIEACQYQKLKRSRIGWKMHRRLTLVTLCTKSALGYIDARPAILYAVIFVVAFGIKWYLTHLLIGGNIHEIISHDNAAYINSYRLWVHGRDVLGDLDYTRGPLAPGFLLWPLSLTWGDVVGVWIFNAIASAVIPVVVMMLARTMNVGYIGQTLSLILSMCCYIILDMTSWLHVYAWLSFHLPYSKGMYGHQYLLQYWLLCPSRI